MIEDIPPEMRALAESVTGGKPAPSASVDEDGYLREEIVLPLTALEAGALAGVLIQASANDRFMVRVKGRAEPMKMTARLIEKLELGHRRWLKEHGF